MKVILLVDVPKLGKANDIVEVTPGFACHHLVPKKMAVYVSKATLNNRNSTVTKQNLATEKFFADLNETAQKIREINCHFVLKSSSEHKTFGHVNVEMILKKLATDFGISISKKCFADNLRLGIGEHQIPLKLHSKVKTVLHVSVSE